MSVEKSEAPSRPYEERNNKDRGTVDLANKLLRVGTLEYNIDMKQSLKARFFCIVQHTPKSRSTRIVVPMVVAADFYAKLEEIYQFSTTYEIPEDLSKAFSREKPFAHSVSLTTASKRRYYLDLLVDEERELNLRISYVFGERRDNVHMNAGALQSLLDIIKLFMTDFPAKEDEVDTPPRMNYQRRNFGDRPRRDFENRRGGQSSFQTRPTGATGATGAAAPFERRFTLKVLEDPAPSSVVINAKKYTFEIVEGSNTFLRVTEIINNNRKSTLHVPVEVCAEIQKVIGDMTSKLSLEPKVQAEKVVTAKESIY